jgi:dihydrolipoamide dehydrogenase
MSRTFEERVPDIGDLDAVAVAEVLVAAGDRVEVEASLITLESDKASMEVPATRAGTVKEVKVAVGDAVKKGSVIVVLELAGESAARPEEPAAKDAAGDEGAPEPAPRPSAAPAATTGDHFEVVVLGSGPGGYTAAFRAADLGKKVALVERYPTLGGVCLNVGCIPSKALLHAAKVIDEAKAFAEHGIAFGEPKVDLDRLRSWKDEVVGRLVKGVTHIAGQRGVTTIRGTGRFASDHALDVDTPDGKRTISFDAAIVAAGSRAAQISGWPYDDPRLMDSTGALELAGVPERLLVIGGGIIGLEMATVYSALGSKITVVEVLDRLIPGCDRDVVRPLHKWIEERYEAIFLETRVTSIQSRDEGLKVYFDGEKAPESAVFDRVLVAVGRKPNGTEIGAEKAGLRVNDGGYVPVDRQQRTNVSHIFAIGDVVGPPMLAHKASHEGKVAAEVFAGMKSSFDVRAIPSIAYTDPEVAWAGVTEDEAKAQGLKYGKGVFPWSANGRSLALGRSEGRTNLLFDEETGRLIGAGVVGPNAGDLISELALAIETTGPSHRVFNGASTAR